MGLCVCSVEITPSVVPELSMKTPAFVRERRKAPSLDTLATPTVFRESQPRQVTTHLRSCTISSSVVGGLL